MSYAKINPDSNADESFSDSPVFVECDTSWLYGTNEPQK